MVEHVNVIIIVRTVLFFISGRLDKYITQVSGSLVFHVAN
jgi:hypothetical protein